MAAADLMSSRGVAATGLSDVLAASGTGKSQLYHYFRDKQDLVGAVIDRQLEIVLAAQPALDGDDIGAWARGILALHDEPGGPFSCPLGVLSPQVDDDPTLRARQSAAFRAWQDRIATMVASARRAGRVDPDVDPDELAGRLLAALQGGLMLARLHRDPRPLHDALAPVLGPGPAR